MHSLESSPSESPRVVNILILGETGVGKSTWINSLINYMTFNDLEEASKAKQIPVPIPSSFTFIQQGVEKIITIGKSDANKIAQVGKSGTKQHRCHTYHSAGGDEINLIDTPGIGDTEGIMEDKKNVDNILSHLAHYEEIHAVCILLKPNNARLDVMFRFCITELLAHLHLSIRHNIVFCFTNARAIFYRPGDTLPILKKELKTRNLGIEVTSQNYFCFDNEPFRFLACLLNGVKFDEYDEALYSLSWKKSVAETKRLFQYIKALKPHKVRNTLCLNEARRIILAMSKPLAEVAQTIQHNVQEGNEAKRQIEFHRKGLDDLEDRLTFPGYDMKRVEFDHPITVCAHPDCVTYIRVGEHFVQNTVFKQICHKNCQLYSPTETTNNEMLENCAGIKGPYVTSNSTDCRECGHHYRRHMHITYDIMIVLVEFLNSEVQSEIKKKGSEKEKKEAFKNAIDTKIRELKKEEKIIITTSAKYGAFLKTNAIIPYNDAIGDYLDKTIELERTKSKRIRDDAFIKSMEEMKREYQEERRILDEAIGKSAGVSNLTPDDIKTLQEQLFRLKHTGRNFKDLFDGISLSQLARNKAGNSRNTAPNVSQYRSMYSSLQRWVVSTK